MDRIRKNDDDDKLYERLSEFLNPSFAHTQFIQSIAENLKTFLHATACFAFVWNEQEEYYKYVYSDSNVYTPNEKVFYSKTTNKTNFFKQDISDQNVKVVPFTIMESIDMLFVLVYNHNDNRNLRLGDEYLDGRDLANNQYGKDKNYQFLYELSTKLFSQINKETILQQIFDALKEVYPQFEYFLLLSQDSESSSDLPVKLIEISDDITKSLTSQVFLTGHFQVEDRMDERRTYLYAPLNGKQGIYGVLQIITPNIVTFSDYHTHFIQELASLAGTALERAILYENSKDQVASLSLVNEISQKLNTNLDLSEIAKIIKVEIEKISQASEIGFIYYPEDNPTEYKILKQSTDYFRTADGFQFARELMDQAMKEGSIFSGMYNGKRKSRFHSVIAIPMHTGFHQGFAIILHQNMYHFTFQSFKLIEAIIQHATLAVTNTLLKDELHRMVITDYLTQLYSRNYLEEKILENMQSGNEGVLLLFDIDNFKQINDTYGHHVGDKVLQQVAEVLKTCIRKSDTPARWGGEELAVYLPDTSMQDGLITANRIRTIVAKITQPHVTVSCGVSSWTKEKEDSIVQLFLRTDQALYEAKSSGKNRVIKN